MAYRIEFAPSAVEHLGALSGRQRGVVVDRIREQLLYQPLVRTRHRKPLRPNALAPWVLRVGGLRVYYDVSETPEPCVTIRAIGVKVRERVFVGGVEIDLS